MLYVLISDFVLVKINKGNKPTHVKDYAIKLGMSVWNKRLIKRSNVVY